MATREQFEQAERRAKNLQREYAARRAYYDATVGQVVVEFPNGSEYRFPPDIIEGLHNALPEDLSEIELSPSGLGLHFPTVDADIHIPALMHNVLGSKAWMAQIGKAGGSVRSERKALSARENGKAGGRPPAHKRAA